MIHVILSTTHVPNKNRGRGHDRPTAEGIPLGARDVSGRPCGFHRRNCHETGLVKIRERPVATVPSRPEQTGLGIRSVDEAEGAAENLRRSWNLGIDPIACMTGVLEDRRIHVLEIESGEKFDGMSAAAINEKGKTVAAAVVTRSGVPGERQRLNLAHELGHLVLEIPGTIDAEKAAFRFGGAFLAPAREVYREVGTKRSFIRLEELLLLKLRFGMSLQALLYRFRDLGIIAETYYR